MSPVVNGRRGDSKLGRLDVHVGIDEAGHQKGARGIEPLATLISAEADDMTVLDRDVDVQPFLREHGQDVAAGQHNVRRLVTTRDRHPVCVDDGEA